MVSFPKNVKYNKVHSYLPQSYDIECKKIKLLRGFIGLKTLQSGHISANQIEAFRRVVIRVLRKNKGSRL
jgi:ribosomal protein L16/L10AE